MVKCTVSFLNGAVKIVENHPQSVDEKGITSALKGFLGENTPVVSRIHAMLSVC